MTWRKRLAVLRNWLYLYPVPEPMPRTRFFWLATSLVGLVCACTLTISAAMLIVKRGVLRLLTRSLAAVGQMAFSNYIFQSVAAVVIFTGTGFALYGRFQRYQLY